MATAVSAATTTRPASSAPPTLMIASIDSPTKYNSEPEKNTETMVAANQEKDEPAEKNDPLPAELRRILTQVARTGRCPWLSWNGEEIPESARVEQPNRNEAANKPSSPVMSSSSSGNRNYSAQRRTPSSAYRASSPMNSSLPRKKRRNGLHMTHRHFPENGNSKKNSTVGSLSSGRKGPLAVLRSQSSSSGRHSGSEPDDSTQYEWDSEETSATTNSELSMGERREKRRRLGTLPKKSSCERSSPPTYKTLCAAIRDAMGLVLDDAYHRHGGYKVSPAEKRINEAAAAALKAEMKYRSENGEDAGRGQNMKDLLPSPYGTYMQRRKLLLARLQDDNHELSRPMLTGNTSSPVDANENGGPSTSTVSAASARPWKRQASATAFGGPPFTIQRIAEVLVDPDRYYMQTHKLCNCMEKLLLVSTPASAFGGSVGGKTSQNRQEEEESSALSDERGRQDSEQQRRIRLRMSPSSDEGKKDKSANDQAVGDVARSPDSSGDSLGEKPEDADAASKTHCLEEAAKASLRHKFDHIGHDPHHGAVDRDARGPNRGLSTSPPPPSSLGILPTTMPPHGFARHLSDHPPGIGDSSPEAVGHHSPLARPPSPILYSPGSDPGSPNAATHPNHNLHLLQMHHAVTMAGLPLGSAPSNIVIDPATGAGRPVSAVAPTGDVGDLEVEPGRSSASNSDLDSESDDFSLDDSASDRSDGSDFDSSSGGPSHYEPFTAARVMALNRMQQQQRLQSRSHTGTASSGSHHGDSFRPPADSDYQSGDSIDSMMAEDSGGSDSSSSDMAD